MYPNILSTSQTTLLPLVHKFSDDFYFVGGTAIALHIGHRRSIDFDLFTANEVNRDKVQRTITQDGYQFQTTYEDSDQLQGIINQVSFTFYHYPFPIEADHNFSDIIKLPSLLTLSAMKAYALGRRAKWKDYVDIYHILRDHHSLEEISNHANSIFGSSFNPKLLRQQLTYFKDINYSEQIEYLGDHPTNEEIEQFLIEVATREL